MWHARNERRRLRGGGTGVDHTKKGEILQTDLEICDASSSGTCTYQVVLGVGFYRTYGVLIIRRNVRHWGASTSYIHPGTYL